MKSKTKYTLSLILAIGLAVTACEDSTATTLIGSGQRGFANGSGSEAKIISQNGAAVDSEGNIIVAEYANNSIRKILMD